MSFIKEIRQLINSLPEVVSTKHESEDIWVGIDHENHMLLVMYSEQMDYGDNVLLALVQDIMDDPGLYGFDSSTHNISWNIKIGHSACTSGPVDEDSMIEILSDNFPGEVNDEMYYLYMKPQL